MIETTSNKLTYLVADNPVYTFNIPFFQAEDIHCFLYHDGAETELVPKVHFSVETREDYSHGAEITLLAAAPPGAKLTIVRQVEPTQDVNLPEYGKLPSTPLEAQLDKLTMIAQQHTEQLGRTPQAAYGGEVSGPELMSAFLSYVSSAYADKTSAQQSMVAASGHADRAQEAEENIISGGYITSSGVSALLGEDGYLRSSGGFTALGEGGAARIGISSGGAAVRYGDAGDGAAVEVDGSGVTLSGFDAAGSAGLSVTASGVAVTASGMTVNGQTVTTDDRVLPLVSGGGYITSDAARLMIGSGGYLQSYGGFTAIGLSDEQTTASGGEIVIDHTNPLFYFSSDIRLVAPENVTCSAYIQLGRNLNANAYPGVAIGTDSGRVTSAILEVNGTFANLKHFHSAYETGMDASAGELLLQAVRTGATWHGAYVRFNIDGSMEGHVASPPGEESELSFRLCDSGMSFGGYLIPSLEFNSNGMFISGAKVVTLPESAGGGLPASGGFVAAAEGGAARISLSDSGAALIYSSGAANNVLSVGASGAALDGQELSVQPRETIDMVATSAVIPMLEGGRRYVFAQPLSALTLGNVASTLEESEILFNAASGGVAVSLPDDLPVANGGVQFAGSGSYILAFRGGVMAAAELVPPFRVNPFDTDLPEAELFGPAVPMTDFALPVNGGRDKFVRWTSNTIPPSSGNLYFGGSAGSGNLYAGLSGFSYSGGIVYGLSSGTELAGSISVRAANCSFSNAIWGGEAGAAIDGALEIELDSVAITGVSYASYAPAAGTTRYTIRGGSFGKQACAGIYRNPTNYGNTLTVCGDLYLNIDGTALSGNLIYGDRCKPASGASGMIHQRGDIYLELNSGSAEAEEFCAYSGYLFTGSSDNAISAAGNVRVTINGGTWGDRNNLVNGRGIFGGQFCSDSTATVEEVNITMNGGEVSIIHGGGCAQTTGSSQVLGDVTITLNGGKVGNLLGCGSETGDASTSIGGNINIFLNGGEVSGVVHAAVRHTATQSVSGSSTVTVSGTSNYACNFYGYTGLNIADGSRFAALVLKNYTGTLSGAVQGFATVTLEGRTAAALTGDVSNNADAWTFDISRRDITLAGTPLVSGCTPNAVKLIVGGGTPAADWALLAASALPTGGIEIWNAGGSAALATVTALDVAISGTGTACDGWGVSVSDGKLVFKNLTTEAE